MGIADLTAAVRQPEYTGENRCVPCTVVNVLLAIAIGAPIAAVSPPIGAAALAGCLLVIFLRGYLVPGTPALTEAYLPPAVLRLFGKEPLPRTLGDPQEEGEDGWEILEAAGIVERRGASIALSEDFRERWWTAIRERRDRKLGERAVARMMDADATDVARRGDRAFSVGASQLLRWDSRAALLADVAAAAVFRERFENWTDFDRGTRRELFDRHRLLLERCPDCDGPVRRDSESVDPCCQRSYTAVWTECEDCGALLSERSVVDGSDADLGALVADTN